MSTRYKCTLTFVGALSVGWLIGYAMSGKHTAPLAWPGKATGPRAPAVAKSIPRALPKATADEEKKSDPSILSALRVTNYARRIHDLYAAVAKMSPGEISDAITQAQRMTEQDRVVVLPMLFGKWAETDPQAALDFALGLAGYERYGAISSALEIWVAADMNRAIAWAQALPAGENRRIALLNLISPLAKHDPAAAFQFLRTLPQDQSAADAYTTVFSAWAARDPRAAASQVLSVLRWQSRDWQNRGSVIGQIAARWAETDPAAAVAWARQLPDADARRYAVDRAFEVWVNLDPKAASAHVLALPPGTARTRIIGSLVRTLAPRDVPAALGLIEQMPAGETRNYAVQNLTAQWAGSEPAAAAAYAAALPPGNARTSALLGVASQWARKNPQAAVAYFTALSPGDARNAAVRDIAGIWAETDMGAALALVDWLPDDGMKRDAQRDVISRWARKDPRAAADYCIKKDMHIYEDGSGPFAGVLEEWATHSPEQALACVRQIRDERVRGDLLVRIIYRMALTDPDEAASLVAQLPVANQMSAASEVSSRWARLDPAASAAWVVQLPEGEARTNAHREVALRWASLDPAETVSWIGSLPAGNSRDAAVRAYAEATSHAAPEGAATLASTIADAKIRDTTLAGIAYEWLRTDKKAAVKWISQSQAMSAEIKQRLLPKN